MPYNRISARRGSVVDLSVKMLQGGQLADPFCIYRVEIYRGSVIPENIVEVIEVASPDTTEYPYPLIRGEGTGLSIGHYNLPWLVPKDVHIPDVYFDVWYFYSTDPRVGVTGTGTSGTDDLAGYENELLQQCNRFWIYPEQWYVDGGLETVNFGFEPINQKFRKPERRPLEIGLMPLPLYDYNFNLVTPLIPYLTPTISIWTENCEEILVDQEMTIKLRQGSYRSNPFVMSYLLNSSLFFIGTYKYRVTINLPDGTTRVSQDFFFTIN